MLKPIILIEDSLHDAELTMIALGEARLANDVIVLRDGVEALDYLRCQGPHACREKGNPALILLDIKLPKVDGLQVLEQIKQNADLKNVPVVMLTGSAESPDLDRSYELGANGYVVKPVGFPEFVSAVKDIGGYWAMLNEPPSGSKRVASNDRALWATASGNHPVAWNKR